MLRFITILSLFACLKAQAQTITSPEIILQKMRELHLQTNLDSIRTPIAFYKSQSVIDSTKQFYIYRDTLFHSEGKYSTGYTIIDPFMEGNGIPIGEWITYYDNGKLFCKGNYKIGAYAICQAGGPHANYYAYRTGPWTYWYDNGLVMAQGEFPVIWKIFTDTCGDDRYIITHSTKDWKFFNDNGLPYHKNKDLVKLVDQDHL